MSVHPNGRRKRRECFVLWVRVKPRSRTDEVLGWGDDGLLEVQLKAFPKKGEANRSCCRVLAERLNLPHTRVVLEKGQSSVYKKFRIEGLSQQEGERMLGRDPIQGE